MSHEEHADHGHLYRFIFGLLCVFTAVSWLADECKEYIPGVWLLPIIVLGVAVMKALCVLLIFMHIKFERAWKYVLLAPTTILAIGLPLALLPDVGVHYYHMDVPQDPISDQAFEDLEPTSDAGHSSH